jgi:hypothetical protein
MKNLIIKTLKLSFPTFILFLALSIPSHAQSNSPMDTVNEWISVYGVDQDRASELTTLKFREGIPKKIWADETFRILKKGGYKHIEDKFLGISVRDMSSMIVIESTIETIAGITKQKEIYILNIENGDWLIEDIVVEEKQTKEKDIIL